MKKIVISEGQIRAVWRGGQAAYSYEEGHLEEAFSALLKEKPALRRNAVVLLPPSIAAPRVVDLPAMPRKATAEAIEKEVNYERAIFVPLCREGICRYYLAAVLHRERWERMEALWNRLHLRPARVGLALEETLEAAGAVKALKKASFWCLGADEKGVDCLRFVSGKCVWYARSALMAPVGTWAWAEEVEQALREAEQRQGSLSQVYYLGPGEVKFQRLPVEKPGRGRRGLDVREKKKSLCPVWYLGMAVIAALAVLIGAEMQNNIELERERAALERSIADTASIQRQWAYRRALADRRNMVEEVEETLAAYPVLDKAFFERLYALGGEQVEETVTGWDSGSGCLSFLAETKDVTAIPAYVQAAEASGLFREVGYDGYTLVQGRYVLELQCILEGGVS